MKNNKIDRMKNLIKSFDQRSEIFKEERDVKINKEKIKEESNRFKKIARIDEYVSNQFYSNDIPFVAGYGQTVNTFIPNTNNNKKYNPNYTYLQPSEALNVSIKRVLESGAPINDISFYDEVNWNLNNMGFDSKSPIDIKNAILKMCKD